jgi:hypothetical protein
MGGLLALIAALVLALAAPRAQAGEHRDRAERAAFMRANLCPATGLPRGSCEGYVVDHVWPLCGGGADRPFNMQWQLSDEARQKDRWERSICRSMRRSSVSR